VRATGGLDDTIDEETGFKFQPYSGVALLGAIRAAVAAYRKKDRWNAMIRRGMLKDFSWNASAKEYSLLYRQILSAAGSRAA
jgi:starch synthase